MGFKMHDGMNEHFFEFTRLSRVQRVERAHTACVLLCVV